MAATFLAQLLNQQNRTSADHCPDNAADPVRHDFLPHVDHSMTRLPCSVIFPETVVNQSIDLRFAHALLVSGGDDWRMGDCVWGITFAHVSAFVLRNGQIDSLVRDILLSQHFGVFFRIGTCLAS